MEGAHLSIYDPKVSENKILENLKDSIHAKLDSFEIKKSVTSGADAILIITEWDDFKEIEWSNISELMRNPAWIFDCRDIVDLDKFRETELNIWKLGHGSNIKNLK